VSSLAADNWNQFYRPQPPDCADVRTAGQVTPNLARGFATAVLRSDHRTGAGTPRHARGHLPNPLVRSHGQGAL